MERRNILANAAFLVIAVVFIESLMIAVPDQALHLLIVASTTVALTLLVLWRARIDSRKDERTMQIFTLGMRNGFIFLMFAMPGLVAYIGYGVLVVNALLAFYVLWIAAVAIVWISALYYFHAR
jgi:hypothetical protein